MKTLAALVALLMLGTACTRENGGPGVGGRMNSFTVPHTLRYATAEDITGLNPHLAVQSVVGLLSSMTMAYLIKWDVHNKPYPELATVVPNKANGGVSSDGLTITYHLRRNVKWSDGAPFTADDVKFSIGVVLNPANNEVARTGWNFIKSIDEPDKYTIVLHMTRPYSPFLETFFSTAGGNPCILPKHLLAQYPNINNVPYNAKPIGIGPFKYVRWDRASQVVLEPNPLYFRGLPKLKSIIFKIVPNTDTALAELMTHDLDLWWPVGSSYLPEVQKLAPQDVILRQPGYIYNHLDFNLQRPRDRELAVRQALLLGTDRVYIRDTLGHGIGIVQDQVAPETSPYYDPSIGTTKYDPAAANALLDKAGWKIGPDGIRAKNGVELNMVFATTNGSPAADKQIELIRSMWKKLGVAITVRHYAPPMFFAPARSGGVVYGSDWDVIYFAWTADALGDFSSIYGCKEFPPNGQNELHWCNQKANAAMVKFYSDFDRADQTKDAAVTMKELTKDVPTIVMNVREDIWAVNSDLKNFHPNDVAPFDNMMDVDI